MTILRWRSRAILCAILRPLGLACALWLAGASFASAEILDVRRAAEMSRAGTITMVDVRSVQEWRQTGVVPGAREVTIHDPQGAAGFLAAMLAAVDGDRDRPIGLICATGIRSTRALELLRADGFSQIYNVRAGMFGNPTDGPGWVASGLPVVPCRSC